VGNKNHALTQKQIAIAQRRKIVAANLLAGATYREIADVLKVSPATIAGDYKALLDEWKKNYAEKLDRYLYVQMRRLDVLLNAIWERARTGDGSSIDRALSIMDRQNTLMQVTKPQQVNLNQGLIFNIMAIPQSGSSSGDTDSGSDPDGTIPMLNSIGLLPDVTSTSARGGPST
jgi:uncharacterized protein YerC